MTSKATKKFNIKPTSFDDFAWAFQCARVASRAFHLLIRELRSPVRMPLSRSIRGWRLGFGRLANLVYQLDRNDPNLYVSQFQQVLRCPRINGHHDHLLNNKLLFPKLMHSLGLMSPQLIAFKRKGEWRTDEGLQIHALEDWLLETLQGQGQIVLKPVKGHKGQGLAFLERRQEDLLVNGFPSNSSEVVSMLQQTPDSVITEFASQGHYAQTLYPLTANTVRVLTLWDNRSSEPFVAAAAQRIGTKRSFPTDHWLSGLGGLSAEVDLKTGSLSRGATVSRDWKLIWHDEHPETKAKIYGTTVPGFSGIVARLTEAARELAWTPQIAWDILVTRTDFTVIEVNGAPGLPVHQVHRPLLTDQRARDFYKAHQVVR